MDSEYSTNGKFVTSEISGRLFGVTVTHGTYADGFYVLVLR